MYITVKQASEQWGITDRRIRALCAEGRILGATREGRAWKIPSDSAKPIDGRIKNNQSASDNILLKTLCNEKQIQLSGGIYHKFQIEMTYNSNHIEGSRLTQEQTRYIYETNTIGFESQSVNVDDVMETVNHFRCIDMVLEQANVNLSEGFIKELHRVLKGGTSDARKEWFAVGDYKKKPNEVGGNETTPPHLVHQKIRELLQSYNSKEDVSVDDIIAFHHDFEKIHPFQDGNGRVGRLIMLKECLRHNVVPIMIDNDLKMFYYRGLAKFNEEEGYLRNTCLTGQDKVKKWLDYFEIEYQ